MLGVRKVETLLDIDVRRVLERVEESLCHKIIERASKVLSFERVGLWQ